MPTLADVGEASHNLKIILLAIAVAVTIQIMLAAAGRSPSSFCAAETGRASNDHLRMPCRASCGHLPTYCRRPVDFYASPDARNVSNRALLDVRGAPERVPADCREYAGHILGALYIEIPGDPDIIVSTSTRQSQVREDGDPSPEIEVDPTKTQLGTG